MITRAKVENFRCFRSVEFTLAPLTILVGPNASGKSSLLQALVPDFGLSGRDSRTRDKQWFSISTTNQSGGESARRLNQHLGHGYSGQLLKLDVHHLRTTAPVREAERLTMTGENLVNVFATLARPKQEAVARELCRLVPVLADVHARPAPSSGYHRLVFQDRWEQEVWYEPQEVSDGTILALAFLVLPHQRPPVDLLAIEEPERGLHPYLVGEVLSLLRKIAEGAVGPKPVQVVLATHSPTVLDFARPEEVRFLSRKGDEVVVEEAPTTTPEWQEAFREYRESLGEAWLSGGLGGVPGG